MGVTVTGGSRLDATMRDAAGELGRLTDGHRAAATLIARAARPPRRTGRLAASIRPVPDTTAAVVEATAAYAVPVHGGVPRRGIRPQPFLRDAVIATERGWLEEYRQAVQAVLDDVKGA